MAMKLIFTHIDHPESKTRQSALHSFFILLKPRRYCDMEVDKLMFNMLYLRYCRWNISTGKTFVKRL